jgi:predicted ATPase/DNA-binding SARP family transcriptional activator
VTANDGQEIGLASEKERGVVAALILHRPSAVSADRLADALWNQEPPRTALKTVQTYVLRLRSRLGRGAIETEAGGYRLNAHTDDVDVVSFERAISHAGTGAGRAGALASALRLWRGRPYEDLGDWPAAVAEAARLDELRRHAEEEWAEAILDQGGHRQGVSQLEALVAAEPLRERRWALLMLALYRSGRQADALRALAKVRNLLREELGIDPGAALQDLEQAILTQAPALLRTEPDRPTLPPSAAPEAAVAPPGPLPHGTVTFLFTDTDTVGDGRPSPDELLGDRMARHHGVGLERTGEGFAAVFERAADAVLAALDVQLQGIRIGIGLHSGEAEEGGGSYFGPTVNRATSLSRAAHGGQILLSAATRELTIESLPGDLTLADLGVWSFAGLARPERVFQVCHPALQSVFPRLRSGRPSAGALPAQTTSFVDREEECRHITGTLTSSQLITLVGEGGVGKTRLALEVAGAEMGGYGDGVWFCDLSTVDDREGVIEQVAASIGVYQQPGVDPCPSLVESLRLAELLLIVDNCEHVREHVADLIDSLLVATATTRIIATSREPLHVPGERVVRIQPLPDIPAVKLLIDRATAAGAAVDSSDPSLPAIAVQLDGIPLALELAAARTATMALPDLARRLDRRLDVLTTPTAPKRRQRTLRAAMDWSYDLLDEPSRDLFEALSIFSGGWALDAAEHLAQAVDIPADAAGGIVADLTDKSMIRLETSTAGNPRYAMLGTLREYALARLASSDHYGSVAARHAECFVALAERIATESHGPHEGLWVARLDDDFDNIRATFRWCVDTASWGPAMRLLASLVDETVLRERLEVGRWATDLLAHEDVGNHPVRGIALAIASNAAMVEGRMNDAVALAHEAITSAESSGGPRTWLARNTLALLVAAGLVAGRTEDHLEAMSALTASTGDPMGAAVALFDRALLASFRPRPEEGLPAAEHLVALGKDLGSPSITAMGLLSLGRALAASDVNRALPALHDALDLATAARSSLLAAEASRSIVELEARQGDHSKALTALRELLREFEQSGDQSQQLQTILSMLESLLALGELDTVAVLGGGLARTPWGMSASFRMIDRLVAERLAPEHYLAAHELGASMTPAGLVALTEERVGSLLGSRAG